VRWREIKQGKKPSAATPSAEPHFTAAPVVQRAKALIIDVFMIYIPLLYLTTYIVLDGKEAFQSNQWAIFIDSLLFGLILASFWAKTGQSPGCRAYELQIIHTTTGEKPNFFQALWRYVAFLLAGTTVIGVLLAPFRQDKKNLHDLLSRTLVIAKTA
jgi:uncharacterized RDD family membrane protein YckC